MHFTIARDGPDLYLKALKRRGIYVCATFKNGSALEMCLEVQELILQEEPVLPQNPTVHEWKMWDLHVAAVVKNEEFLRQNFWSLYAVVDVTMWLYYGGQGHGPQDYKEIKWTRNTLKLLQVIKQLMYLNASEELHTIHNQVMYTIKLFWMRQEEGNRYRIFGISSLPWDKYVIS